MNISVFKRKQKNLDLFSHAGDVAGAILTLRLPKHTKDFTVSLRMDSAVRGMKPRAEGADANLIVTGDDMMRLAPTASAELSEEEMR